MLIPIKCRARVCKVYKTKKADSIWPLYRGYREKAECIKNEKALQYPQCHGNITIRVAAYDDPYLGGTSAKLKLEVVCTDCVYPYFDGAHEAYLDTEKWVNRIINEHFQEKEDEAERRSETCDSPDDE